MRTIKTTAAVWLLAGALPALAQDAPAAEGSAAQPAEQQAAPLEPAAPATESQPAATAETAPAQAATVPVEELRPEPAEAAPAPQSGAVALDAVEVTAQRRKQKLQDVPVAVTAMTRDQVESRGIGRLDDLNSLAPGLQISRSPSNTTISQITLRGSSQINPALYWDPAVGVYLDGVYIGKGQGSIFDVVNLDGVEVLRGPQGTLYGRNTIGGTINFVTREPSGQFGGNATVELGNYGARVGKLALDLPSFGIVDLTLGARMETRDGWVKITDASPVPEMNNRDNQGLSVGALLHFAEHVEGMYRYDHSKVDQTNVFDQLYRYDRPEAARYVHKTRQTEADIDSPSLEYANIQGHSFTLTWDAAEWLTVKSISGWRKLQWRDYLDLDGSPLMLAHTKRLTDYKQVSQDFNLSGSAGSWHYTGGVYYFKDDGYTNNPQTFDFGSLNFDSQYGTHSRASAAYGQLDWQLLENWTLTAGLRYTRESKVLDRTLGFSPVPPEAGPLQQFVYYIPAGFRTPEVTFKATTPVFSIAWQALPSLNTYLRYAEGFKSGGFNGEYSNLQDTPGGGPTMNDNETATSTPFRPELQKSLELGIKSSFFEGRALLNLAAFRNQLVDLQVSTFSGQGAAASTISNAGKATVRGLELESAFILFEGTQLRANYALLNPRYTEFIDNDENVADNRAFVHAPRKSYNVVLDSRFFGGNWGELRGIVDYVWTDTFYTYPYQLQPDPNPPGQQKQEAEDTRVPAIGLLNAKLSVASIPVGGNLGEISVWGRNLTDNAEPNNFIDFGPGLFASLTVANFVEPRTFGLSATLRW